MEDQNRTVTQSPSLTHSEPPTTPVLEQAVADTNTAPQVMGAVGVHSVSDSVAGAKSEAVGSEQEVKRGRGRPRKYDVNGNLLSPVSAPPGFSTYPFGSSVKRSRGRPRGSGKLQILASIGGFVAETAGGNFTPHVLIVNTGEDLVSRIFSFSQNGPRAVCILSATGAVSSVIIRKPGASGGVLRYEGRFEILSLSGSCTYVGGAHRKSGMLSISLAKTDGKVFGGGVESSLIAAGPIQLILATFKQNICKQIKRRHLSVSSTAPNMPGNPDSVRVPLKVTKLIEGEQSCPSPTSGLLLTTKEVPDNVIPETTSGVQVPDNVIPATTTGVTDNVIPATTDGVADNVISPTTNGVPDNVIPACHNMHSAASVTGVGLDCQTLQPITDQRTSADDDTSGPQI